MHSSILSKFQNLYGQCDAGQFQRHFCQHFQWLLCQFISYSILPSSLQTPVNTTDISFQGSQSIARGRHMNMLIGSITNLWNSTLAAQQSINLLLLCYLFYCLQVIIPNLYRSLQVLDSLRSPSFSADNYQKKKNRKLKLRTLSSAFFMWVVSILPTLPPAIDVLSISVTSFPTLYLLQWIPMQLFQSYQSHFPLLPSIFLSSTQAFLFLSGWNLCSQLSQTWITNKFSSIRLSWG